MTPQQHLRAHRRMHAFLAALITDFMIHRRASPRVTSVTELFEWSLEQTKHPTEEPRTDESTLDAVFRREVHAPPPPYEDG